MKVKIGDKIYNEENEPIIVILNSEDKKAIKTMNIGDFKYCVYPDGISENDIIKFMKDK